MKLSALIYQLEQALKNCGDVDVLVWNHDRSSWDDDPNIEIYIEQNSKDEDGHYDYPQIQTGTFIGLR